MGWKEGRKEGRNQGVMGCLDMSLENVNTLDWQVRNKNANTNIDKLIQITDARMRTLRAIGPMAQWHK